MKIEVCTLLALLVPIGLVYAQCAPGVPSAGNPACIPPNQPNSPYFHSNNASPPALAPAPSPQWADRWGSVAIDEEAGQAGSEINQKTRHDAETAALAACVNHGGGHCQVLQSFMNQCASIAQLDGGGFIVTGTAANSSLADERAMSRCTSRGACQIIYSECSLPVLER